MLAGYTVMTRSILRHPTNTAGCDSIVETHLTVDNVIYSYDSLSICSGDSALIAGNYESTGGVYRDTLTAQAGCDSSGNGVNDNPNVSQYDRFNWHLHRRQRNVSWIYRDDKWSILRHPTNNSRL